MSKTTRNVRCPSGTPAVEPASEQVVNLVAEERQCDAATMRLTACERLPHVHRLLELDARRVRWLERIHHRFDDAGSTRLARGRQRLLERCRHLLRLLA